MALAEAVLDTGEEHVLYVEDVLNPTPKKEEVLLLEIKSCFDKLCSMHEESYRAEDWLPYDTTPGVITFSKEDLMVRRPSHNRPL